MIGKLIAPTTWTIGGRRNEATRHVRLAGPCSAALGRLSPDASGRCAALVFQRPPHFARTRARPGARRRRPTRVAGRRGDVAVWQWGSGPRVLLVHGWGGNAARLRHFVAPLVEAGFGVAAFDAPAHGLSHGSFATLPDFIETVGLVARRHGLRGARRPLDGWSRLRPRDQGRPAGGRDRSALAAGRSAPVCPAIRAVPAPVQRRDRGDDAHSRGALRSAPRGSARVGKRARRAHAGGSRRGRRPRPDPGRKGHCGVVAAARFWPRAVSATTGSCAIRASWPRGRVRARRHLRPGGAPPAAGWCAAVGTLLEVLCRSDPIQGRFGGTKS